MVGRRRSGALPGLLCLGESELAADGNRDRRRRDLALRFYPFPFIVAIIALALWFMSMDLAPWLLAQRGLLVGAAPRVSTGFGLAVMAVAWLVDLKRRSTQDFAFWLHLCGILAFWAG